MIIVSPDSLRPVACTALRLTLVVLPAAVGISCERPESALKNSHCLVFILYLGSLVLTLHHQTCRQMRYPYRRRSLVYMLSACARCAKTIYFKVSVVNVNICRIRFR